MNSDNRNARVIRAPESDLLSNHLVLNTVKVAASEEWRPSSDFWLLLRLSSGLGYWKHDEAGYRELSPGDALLLFPSSKGTFLASRVGDACVELVTIDIGLLSGILTMPECRGLAAFAGRNLQKVVFLPGSEPMASRFSAICEIHKTNALVARLRLLEVFSELLNEGFTTEPAPTFDYADGRARLRKLINEMPEAELMRCSVAELAKKLCCSQRHFSRLFREELGMSLRENQKRLRLEHARHLLEKSTDKIIDVAFESGYTSLSLFNVMFKERYKMTPSQWRQRAQLKKNRARPAGSKPIVRILAGALLAPFLAAGLAFGAEPASATTNSPVFAVHKYEVRGNSLLREETIDSLMAKHTGTNVDFTQIRAALGALILAYRERGYATVGVSLPQQQITNGTIRVQVTEGVLTDIQVRNNRYYSSNNVLRALPSLQTNMVLNSRVFQAELDQANGNRDRQIYPELQPGTEPGASTLVLKVKDRLPLHGKVEFNNHKTPQTPNFRLNSSVQYNNLWQLDHAVGLQYGFTPQEFKTEHEGRHSSLIDRPLIAYYNGFYRLPIGNLTPLADRIAQRPTEFGFSEATRQFVLPPPSSVPELLLFANRSTTDSGLTETTPRPIVDTQVTRISVSEITRDFSTTEAVGFRLNHPFSVGLARLTLSGGADLKHYESRGFSTNAFRSRSIIPGANPADPPQEIVGETLSGRSGQRALTYLPVSARAEAFLPDRMGYTSLSVGAAYTPALDPFSDDGEFRTATGSPRSQASFLVGSSALTRDQHVYAGWRVLLRAEGQYSDDPVFTNEQFALGGVQSVRGYLQGESFGDAGWRLSVEPRTPAIQVGRLAGQLVQARLSTFVDFGRTYLHDPLGRAQNTTLAGTGLGMNWTIGQIVDASAVIGFPLYESAHTSLDDRRIYLSFSAQF